MGIFDGIAREDTDPLHQDEAAFAYLNRSGRLVASRVRRLVDDWLTHYTANSRHSLIGRLRSSIDDQHRSAFFELFVHELVITRGHKLIEIEPNLMHTAKSPGRVRASNLRNRRTGRGWRRAVEQVLPSLSQPPRSIVPRT